MLAKWNKTSIRNVRYNTALKHRDMQDIIRIYIQLRTRVCPTRHLCTTEYTNVGTGHICTTLCIHVQPNIQVYQRGYRSATPDTDVKQGIHRYSRGFVFAACYADVQQCTVVQHSLLICRDFCTHDMKCRRADSSISMQHLTSSAVPCRVPC